jgi:hypothetical protein
MMSATETRDVLVRVDIARMIENAARSGRPMNDLEARQLLQSWGFRQFGQFWRGTESQVSHLRSDEIERIDLADRRDHEGVFRPHGER